MKRGPCCGPSRREMLKIGGLSMLGLALPDYLALRAQEAARARAKSVILVWLNGGPSHLDLFDLKPEAPAEFRGEFQPIPTAVKGLRICEHLPRLAKVMDRATLVRSVTSSEGNHDRATHHLLTGWHPSPSHVHPSMGSVATKELGLGAELPSYVAVPAPVAYSGAGFLTAAFEPFAVGADPSKPGFKVDHLEPSLAPGRLQRRREVLRDLDAFFTSGDASPDLASRGSFFEQAWSLLSSPRAKEAFDLSRETDAARQRYGLHRLGQSCLLARRLVEAGVRFVTVQDEGWDTHDNLWRRFREAFAGGGGTGKVFQLDQSVSALIEDLDRSGRLAETMVIVMGEFGRTPKINATGGRDHWPRANSVLLAGGGIRRGHVHGATDATGELPTEDPVEPEDLAATIYGLLGIDPSKEYRTPTGRPIRILGRGKPVEGILG